MIWIEISGACQEHCVGILKGQCAAADRRLCVQVYDVALFLCVAGEYPDANPTWRLVSVSMLHYTGVLISS